MLVRSGNDTPVFLQTRLSSGSRLYLPVATFTATLYMCHVSAALLTSGEKSTSPMRNFLQTFSA